MLPKQQPLPDELKVNWAGNIPFVLMHIGALMVFWVGVTPVAFLIFLITLLPRMFGLTAGYHRYFSHRSFKTSRVFQFILAFLGACALQKDCLWWAAHHRNHHRFSDTDKDTHSPVMDGFYWSHIGWFMAKKNYNYDPIPHIPDFAKYPELRFLRNHQKTPGLLMLGLVLGLGYVIQNFFPGLETSLMQILVWGFFISTVFLYHVTFSVNSFSHMFGSRRFQTKDDSRNNVVVALLTMGEGWHNNHHRFPSSERQGIYWWELDMTHVVLTILSWFGIVWDLNKPPKEIYEEARQTAHVQTA